MSRSFTTEEFTEFIKDLRNHCAKYNEERMMNYMDNNTSADPPSWVEGDGTTAVNPDDWVTTVTTTGTAYSNYDYAAKIEALEKKVKRLEEHINYLTDLVEKVIDKL